MRLLLLRHGQTDWNAAERYQGRTDIELNATGLQQAEDAARRLAETDLHAVYASPLGRARRTAEIAVRDRGLDITLDDGLMETAGGDWEGLTYAEISARWPQDFAAWRAAHPEHGPVGGETPGRAGLRVIRTLRGLVSASTPTQWCQHDDQQVLVVAHGGCLRAATALLVGEGQSAAASYASLERLQNGRMIVLEGEFGERDPGHEGGWQTSWRIADYNV